MKENFYSYFTENSFLKPNSFQDTKSFWEGFSLFSESLHSTGLYNENRIVVPSCYTHFKHTEFNLEWKRIKMFITLAETGFHSVESERSELTRPLQLLISAWGHISCCLHNTPESLSGWAALWVTEAPGFKKEDFVD